MNSLELNSEYMNHLSPQYTAATSAKMELAAADQPIMYQGSPPLYLSSSSSSPAPAAPVFFHDAGAQVAHQPFGSPDSFMSGLSPQHSPLSHHPAEPPMLVASSSSSTTASSASSNSYLNQTLAKASSLPESFYPEFLQYSKESFEQSASGSGSSVPKSKKRRCQQQEQQDDSSSQEHPEQDGSQSPQLPQGEENETDDANNMTTAEMRRQIHIQSEQKRRAQIKDGFEDLRNELPACLNKKMSKVALLHRTVQHIQHLKSTQMTILAELERLVHENEQLRKFQQGVLQKQALENMYTMGNM